MQQPNSSSAPIHTSVRIVLMSMDENGNTTAYPPNLAQEFISHFVNPFGAFPFMPTQNFGNHASFEDFLDHLMRTHEPRGSPPTSKEAIQKLEQITIGSKEVEDKTECAICKDAFSLEDSATRLPCTHLYHPTCIVKWLEMHSTCPVCRFQLPTEESTTSSATPTPTSSATPASPSTPTQTPPPPTPPSTSVPSEPSPSPSPNDTPATSSSTAPTASIRIISIETHEENNEEEFEEAQCAFGRTRREECTLVNGEREFVSLTCGCTYHTECLESFLRISGELNIGSSIYSESTPFRCPTCKQNALPVKPLDVD